MGSSVSQRALARSRSSCKGSLQGDCPSAHKAAAPRASPGLRSATSRHSIVMVRNRDWSAPRRAVTVKQVGSVTSFPFSGLTGIQSARHR